MPPPQAVRRPPRPLLFLSLSLASSIAPSAAASAAAGMAAMSFVGMGAAAARTGVRVMGARTSAPAWSFSFSSGRRCRSETVPKSVSVVPSTPGFGDALRFRRRRRGSHRRGLVVLGDSPVDDATAAAVDDGGEGVLGGGSAAAVSTSSSERSASSPSPPTSRADAPIVVPRNFVPFPFQYHQELVLEVSSLTNLGVGVCRTDIPEDDDEVDGEERGGKHIDSEESMGLNGDAADGNGDRGGWVVMVPNVIPGETVRVRIYRNRGSYSEADLTEILHPSPDRVEPKCPLSSTCGGCQYQHVSVDVQREWKRMHVRDCLIRVGGLEEGTDFPTVMPALGSDEVYNYRSKITPHYDAPEKKGRRGKKRNVESADDRPRAGGAVIIGPIGFKEKTSRKIIDVPQCPIATEAINEKLTELRDDLHRQTAEGKLRRPHKGATLLLREVDGGLVVTDNNEYVKTSVGNLTFRFRAGNFFQNNPFVLPLMVERVVEACAADANAPASAADDDGGGKPTTRMTHLIDCYCGSGLFGLAASTRFERCVGIEVNERAVEEARYNAESNGIENCEFVAASAEAIFEGGGGRDGVAATGEGKNADDETAPPSPPSVRDFPRDSTVVLVDPPRRGCSEEFLRQLYDFSPRRLVYLSCDPSTQARDARGLVANGYQIVSALPIDLFPQTRHIESLIVFERKKGASHDG